MKLFQWGRREYASSAVELQRWEETSASQGQWMGVMRGSSLEGQRWDTVRFIKCATIVPPTDGRVAITNGGFYPSEAAFECNGAQIYGGISKTRCLEDGTWYRAAQRCWSLLEIFIATAVFTSAQVGALSYYYFRVMGRRAPALHKTSYISDESLGRWTTDMFQGFHQRPRRILFTVLFCPCMRLADTWHSAGLLKYYFGIWIPQCFFPVLPCVGAYFRGNIRDRFQIQGTCFHDLLLWTCCCPCSATQEAKHVDEMCALAEEERIVQESEQRRKREQIANLEAQVRNKNEEVSTQALRFGKPAAEHLKAPTDVRSMHALKQSSILDALSTGKL